MEIWLKVLYVQVIYIKMILVDYTRHIIVSSPHSMI